MNRIFTLLVVVIVTVGVVWFAIATAPKTPNRVTQITEKESKDDEVGSVEDPAEGDFLEVDPEIKESHPDSIDALQEKFFQSGDLVLGRVLAKTDLYTRYYVTYGSEGLTISGILNIPSAAQGDGPFPVLFLNHGYIDPAIYTNGRGLKREQDFFARNGYAVFHSDYRDHADSDPDPYRDIRPRTGYTEDVINAMYAVQNSDIDALDKKRFGTLGHSMGGGVVQNIMVIKPDLAQAHVLYAPISSLYQDNFERYVRAENDPETDEILATYGEFDENPDYWASVSAVNYFDAVAAAVEIHHAPTDKDVPYEWSTRTTAALEALGKDITLHTYQNEGHEFGPQWTTFMNRSLVFFDKHVK